MNKLYPPDNDCLRRSSSCTPRYSRDALGELPHLWQPALPLSHSRPQARTALIHQLPREHGKTSVYYVPKAAESAVRRGVEAWSQLQTQLRQLSALNKERALQAARVKKQTHFCNRL